MAKFVIWGCVKKVVGVREINVTLQVIQLWNNKWKINLCAYSIPFSPISIIVIILYNISEIFFYIKCVINGHGSCNVHNT